MEKTLKLSSEDLSKITQYESSISHWSSEHTVLILKAKKMLEGIEGLYQARQKTLDDFLKASDVNPAEVDSLNMSPNGDVVITLKEKA